MTVTGNGKLISHHIAAQRSSSHDGAIILIFLMTSSRSDGGRYQQQIGAGDLDPVSKYLMCWCVDIVESRLYSSWEIKVMATGSAENLGDLNQIKYPIRLISKYFDNATFYRNTLPLPDLSISNGEFQIQNIYLRINSLVLYFIIEWCTSIQCWHCHVSL